MSCTAHISLYTHCFLSLASVHVICAQDDDASVGSSGSGAAAAAAGAEVLSSKKDAKPPSHWSGIRIREGEAKTAEECQTAWGALTPTQRKNAVTAAKRAVARQASRVAAVAGGSTDVRTVNLASKGGNTHHASKADARAAHLEQVRACNHRRADADEKRAQTLGCCVDGCALAPKADPSFVPASASSSSSAAASSSSAAAAPAAGDVVLAQSMVTPIYRLFDHDHIAPDCTCECKPMLKSAPPCEHLQAGAKVCPHVLECTCDTPCDHVLCKVDNPSHLHGEELERELLKCRTVCKYHHHLATREQRHERPAVEHEGAQMVLALTKEYTGCMHPEHANMPWGSMVPTAEVDPLIHGFLQRSCVFRGTASEVRLNQEARCTLHLHHLQTGQAVVHCQLCHELYTALEQAAIWHTPLTLRQREQAKRLYPGFVAHFDDITKDVDWAKIEAGVAKKLQERKPKRKRGAGAAAAGDEEEDAKAPKVDDDEEAGPQMEDDEEGEQ